jgi:hypothetical protein
MLVGADRDSHRGDPPDFCGGWAYGRRLWAAPRPWSRCSSGATNWRGCLALRRGDPRGAEGDARTALAATELPAQPTYRVLNGGLLIEAFVDRGELDVPEAALAPSRAR